MKPFHPNSKPGKAKKQLRKAAVDPNRLDELLGQPTVTQIQAEVAKAQRAERHAALQAAERMRSQDRNDAAALHPKGADSEVA
jgi:multidrug resistance efflux pump